MRIGNSDPDPFCYPERPTSFAILSARPVFVILSGGVAGVEGSPRDSAAATLTCHRPLRGEIPRLRLRLRSE